MATASTTFDGTNTQQQQVYLFAGDCTMAFTALLCYTHLLALQREVECIWSQRFQPVTWLYILIRYPGLLFQLINAGLDPKTPHCTTIAHFQEWLVVVAMISTYLLQILVTRAVCGKSLMLTCFLVIACAPATVTFMWEAVSVTCSETAVHHFAALSKLRTTLTWSSDLVFETSIVTATVWGMRSLTFSKTFGEESQDQISLPRTILYNRILYYVVLVFADAGTIAMQHTQHNVKTASGYWAFFELNYPLRWILLGDFILKLRQRALDIVPHVPVPSSVVMISVFDSPV